jgi:hypothetical protein
MERLRNRRQMPSSRRTSGDPARFFVVINHQGAKPPAYLVQSILFSASLAIAATSVGAVVVVDGSAEPNGKLKTALAELCVGYHHAGRRLSFAEGYNSGPALYHRPWTIFCASDIYPSATVFSALDGFCADAGPEVGCVVPLLSADDLNLQRVGGTFRKAIQVLLMTRNFNTFPTGYPNKGGGVPEEFKGNYNDVVLTLRVQLDKRSIWHIPARCVYFGSLTLNSDGSTISFSDDAEQFRSDLSRTLSTERPVVSKGRGVLAIIRRSDHSRRQPVSFRGAFAGARRTSCWQSGWPRKCADRPIGSGGIADWTISSFDCDQTRGATDLIMTRHRADRPARKVRPHCNGRCLESTPRSVT